MKQSNFKGGKWEKVKIIIAFICLAMMVWQIVAGMKMIAANNAHPSYVTDFDSIEAGKSIFGEITHVDGSIDLSRYTGVSELEVSPEEIDAFYRAKKLDVDPKRFMANQFVILKTNDGSKKSAIGRVANNGDFVLRPLASQEPVAWGIKPLNKEQRFAMELLLDDSLDLVTLVGTAGTGKTLITLATGLQRTMDDNAYRRMVVCRSIVPVGKDLGFLPGTKEEKLEAWMGAIYDNLAFLADRKNPDEGEEKAHYLLDSGKIEIASVTHMRGRSLPGQYMIVDDAQNLTPHEMKTILTRAGEGTKVVVTGDPYQIDTPYLDVESNGLTYLVDRLKGQKNYGHITFTKTERSRLADQASRLL